MTLTTKTIEYHIKCSGAREGAFNKIKNNIYT